MKRQKRWLLKVMGCLVLTGAGVALTAAVKVDRGFTPFDKEYYLTDEQVAFIRPGFNVQVSDPDIAADGTVSVRFALRDAGGLPLDINGVYTPGPVRISFVLAYIPGNGDHYVAYTQSRQVSPITGESAWQASADTGGTLEEIEIGTYRYTFKTKLPADYDRNATHAVGFFAERDLSEFELGAPMADGVVKFVPTGAPVRKIRELTTDEACGRCHDFLRVHGRRHSVELCVLCHYDGVVDPDTRNSVDMRVMIHKIHAGEQLPSVQAGTPYQIIGYRQSVLDFSEVRFPQDLRYCDTCHVGDAAQHDAWLLKPTRAACGSCHDNVDFVSGKNHAGGPAISDRFCGNCHFPEGELEFDASVRGAHTVPAESEQLEGISIEILEVSNVGPGQAPVVLFRMTNKNGDPIDPAGLNFFNLVVAGPTTDYTFTSSEAARASVSAGAPGEYVYSFQTTLPEDAEGTFVVGAEAYRNVTLNPGTTKEFSFRETAENPFVYVAVTDPEPVPRRQIVSDEKCEACHRNLALHGTIRHNADGYCQVCHKPTADDSATRPIDMYPARSIDLRFMVHRIHMGEELTRDYTIVGRGGMSANFNHVLYPSDRRACEMCHLEETYNVPVAGVVPVTDENEFFSPIPPNSAACLGCHDTVEAAAHAFTNLTPFGEGCGACHAAARRFAVAKVHAR